MKMPKKAKKCPDCGKRPTIVAVSGMGTFRIKCECPKRCYADSVIECLYVWNNSID